jgi:hypothetical protein
VDGLLRGFHCGADDEAAENDLEEVALEDVEDDPDLEDVAAFDEVLDAGCVAGGALIVILQVAVISPSDEAAVMVQVPALTAVTSPMASTVAIVASLVAKVTGLSVTSSGATVAVNCWVFPTSSVTVVWSSVIVLTAIMAGALLLDETSDEDIAGNGVVTVFLLPAKSDMPSVHISRIAEIFFM